MDVATLSYTDTDGQHTVKLESAATSLGRSPGQNVILLDPFVSRQHAVIVMDGATWDMCRCTSSMEGELPMSSSGRPLLLRICRSS